MPDVSQLVQIAKASAAAYGLDPALVCAVCDHESGGWGMWAIRYEPAFFERYVKGQGLHPTEAYARAMSWGLMQVMGQTAREFGFRGVYLSQLCDPTIGIDIGCRKLKHDFDAVRGDVHEALLRYNGGGDLEYPDLVMPLMVKYQ